ncbi:MAG: SDR family oxidoreductase [Deinococcus sp.]|nr:SDR family oxidoreductase [Deinococcus sp.]
MATPKLKGRTALVTGGSRGIGRATALALAREGAQVAVMARTAAEVEQTVDEITEQGGTSLAVVANVGSEAEVTAAFERVRRELDHVDILVNNAAVIGLPATLAEVSMAEWRRVMDVNVIGAWLCARAALPDMLERRRGKIINISSGAAVRALPRLGLYCISKAALDHMTRILAVESKPHVQVNCFYPGVVDTQMQAELRAAGAEGLGSELHEMFMGFYRQGQLVAPERPAEAIVWLASSEANSVTGRIITSYQELEAIKAEVAKKN